MFLQSYLVSFQQRDSQTYYTSKKGKKAITDLRNGEPNQKKEAKEPWRRPDTGWTKLNVDASFSAEQNSGTWGAILRDDTGNVIISAWGLIDRCLSAEIAEALACLEGVKAILPVVAKPWSPIVPGLCLN
jgi:hypothetical protein